MKHMRDLGILVLVVSVLFGIPAPAFAQAGEAASSGNAEIDVVRKDVASSPTISANAARRLADLYRWYRVLWHQGYDMRAFDEVRDALFQATSTAAGRKAVDEGYRILETIQNDGEKVPSIAGDEDSKTSRTDWPLFHGIDSTQVGYSPDAGPSRGEMAWRFPKGLAWNARPHVEDGRVYLVSPSKDTLAYCLEEATGKVIWKGRKLGINLYEGTPGSQWTPSVSGERMAVRTGYWQTEQVVMLDRATGEKLDVVDAWKTTGGEADALVPYKRNHTWVFLADAHTGKALWQFDAVSAMLDEEEQSDGGEEEEQSR